MFERIRSERGRVTLHIAGVPDRRTWHDLREGLNVLAGSAEDEVVLDFSAVAHLDGPAIGAIAFLFKRLRARGRRLILVGLTGQPMALIQELGVAAMLGVPVRPTRHAPRRWRLLPAPLRK